MRPNALTTVFMATASTASASEWRMLSRRDSAYTQPIPIRHDFENGGYWTQVTLGSPGSTLDLQLRSDWPTSIVLSSNSSLCADADGCTDHGSFSQGLSTTFHLSSNVWQRNATFQNGTEVVANNGYEFSDTLSIGPLAIDNLTMAVIYDALIDPATTSWTNVLGLGYGWGEANPTPGNILVQMVSRNLLPTEAYSLWLNTPAADSLTEGELLLGAIDTAKYQGDLVSIDMYNASDTGGGLWTLFSSLEATSPSGSDMLLAPTSDPVPMYFTVAQRYSWFPQDVAEHMWGVVGAEYNVSQGFALVECKLRDSAGSFTMRFGGPDGPQVTVPMRQLVAPSEPDSKNWWAESWNAQGEPLCAFTVQNTSVPSQYMIAMNILSDSYFVFDLYNGKVALAPAVWNATESNVVPFRALHAGIPSAVQAANQPTVAPSNIPNSTSIAPVASTSYVAAAGFATLTTAATTTPSSSSSSSSSGDLSTGAKAGIGVGVGVGGLLIILGIVFLIWRRTRRRRMPLYTPDTATVSTFHSPEMRTETPATWRSTETAQDLPKYQVAEMPGGQGAPAELSPSTVDYTHELDATPQERR